MKPRKRLCRHVRCPDCKEAPTCCCCAGRIGGCDNRVRPSRILTDEESTAVLESVVGYVPWWWLREQLGCDREEWEG